MKPILILILSLFFISASCTKFLIGKKHLTYDNFTFFIKPSSSDSYNDSKFYIIPIDKVKECRKYPYIFYLGSENSYSFFRVYVKVVNKGEITHFALPDSICVNKYPNTIDDETNRYKGFRRAIIIDDRIFVDDNRVMSNFEQFQIEYTLKEIKGLYNLNKLDKASKLVNQLIEQYNDCDSAYYYKDLIFSKQNDNQN